MLIAEFRIDSPILMDALRRVPETTVTYDEEYFTPSGGIRFLFWADGDSFDEFESALAADPTVTNSSRITETTDRCLFRVDLTEDARDVATFPVWSKLDLVLVESRATVNGWRLRMRFPHRTAFVEYREQCRERDLSFSLLSMYHATEVGGEAGTELTDRQHEALIAAYDVGYYEIPRNATLADVADRLDLSSQSVSERLRRGTATIVEDSLLSNALIP